LGGSAYAYFHVPMVAGVIVTAIAAELPIAHPGDVTAGTAAVILGGPAVYLAGNALFLWTVCSHTGRGHGPWRSPSWP
jgi:low temperature requirement protein LtrA